MATRRYLGLQVTIVLAASVLIALAIWAAGPPGLDEVGPARRGPGPSAVANASEEGADSREHVERDADARTTTAADRAAADRARRQIRRAVALETAAARDDEATIAAGSERPGQPPSPSTPELQARPGAERDDAVGSGELTDRVGLPADMLDALNDEFMPLAAECIGEARARLGDLSGMAAMEFRVIADPDIGAVVDGVGFGDMTVGAGADAELQTCLRETALSMLLPEPSAGGGFALMFTLPLAD